VVGHLQEMQKGKSLKRVSLWLKSSVGRRRFPESSPGARFGWPSFPLFSVALEQRGHTCGTQRGETKLVASTVCSPASASRSIRPTLTSVGTIYVTMCKVRGT
jgi:hypothetical protein